MANRAVTQWKLKDVVNPKKELKKKKMKRLTFILSANILNYYNPTKQGGKVWIEREGGDFGIKTWFYASVRAFQVLMAYFYSASN